MSTRTRLPKLQFVEFDVYNGAHQEYIRRYRCPPEINDKHLAAIIEEEYERLIASDQKCLVFLIEMDKFKHDKNMVEFLLKNHTSTIVGSATKLDYTELQDGVYYRMTTRTGELLYSNSTKRLKKVNVEEIYSQKCSKEFNHKDPFGEENIKNIPGGLFYGENLVEVQFYDKNAKPAKSKHEDLRKQRELKTTWLKNVKNLLDELCEQYGEGLDIEGVTTVMSYLGAIFTGSSFHLEDYFLGSFNYSFKGSAPKYWMIVEAKYMAQINEILKKRLAEFQEDEEFQIKCDMFMLHKFIIITREMLEANNIPYYIATQRPNDLLVTFSHTVHQVINGGNNYAIAKNWCYKRWYQEAREIKRCKCPVDGGWKWLFDALYQSENGMKMHIPIKDVPDEWIDDANKAMEEAASSSVHTNTVYTENSKKPPTIKKISRKRGMTNNFDIGAASTKKPRRQLIISGNRMHVNGTTVQASPQTIINHFAKEDEIRRNARIRKQRSLKNRANRKVQSKRIVYNTDSEEEGGIVATVVYDKHSQPSDQNDDQHITENEEDEVIPKSNDDESSESPKESDDENESSESPKESDDENESSESPKESDDENESSESPKESDDENEASRPPTPNEDEIIQKEASRPPKQREEGEVIEDEDSRPPKQREEGEVIEDEDSRPPKQREEGEVIEDEDSRPPKQREEGDEISIMASKIRGTISIDNSVNAKTSDIQKESPSESDEEQESNQNKFLHYISKKRLEVKNRFNANTGLVGEMAADDPKLKRKSVELEKTRKTFIKWDRKHLLMKIIFKVFKYEDVINQLKNKSYSEITILKHFVSPSREVEFIQFWRLVVGEIKRRDDNGDPFDAEIVADVNAWKEIFNIHEFMRIPVDDPATFAEKPEKKVERKTKANEAKPRKKNL